MNKVMLALIIIGFIFFMIVVLVPYQKDIEVKVLVDYKPRTFFKPSIARFDDGTIYENLDFEGGICIGAKYKIVRLRNIFGWECGIRAIRCS